MVDDDSKADHVRPPPPPYVRPSNRQRLAEQKSRREGRRATAATAATAPAPQPAATATERQRQQDGELVDFFRAWQWKREHLPDRLRFEQPYVYTFGDGSGGSGGGGGEGRDEMAPPTATPLSPPPAPPLPPPLIIQQRPYGPGGLFATTVWDSSIVVAKMIERRAALYAGLRCCDLSAGCGLPAAVLAAVGRCAAVVATDMDVGLLRTNLSTAAVVRHAWGDDVAPVLRAAGLGAAGDGRAFDAVFLCDGMYIAEAAAVGALARSVAALVDAWRGVAIVAHGRNRGAEAAFLAEAEALGMIVDEVLREELHPQFVCSDVSVFRLRHRRGAGTE